MIKCIVFISTLMLVNAASKYYDGENRPYEFGFNIEGNQHRHEKKDENGIIMGEFGFITADNVYHVTVYATDADGHFKIISMKNIKLMGGPMAKNIAAAIDSMRSNFESSSPQGRSYNEDTTTTPQPFVIHSTASPAAPAAPAAPIKELEITTVEPTTQKTSNIQSCSNCKIPEPPRPANVPYNQNSLPQQMPSLMDRLRPQEHSMTQGMNLNFIDQNSYSAGQGQDTSSGNLGSQDLGTQGPQSSSSGAESPQSNDDSPIPPSTNLSPPLTTSMPANEGYSADLNSLQEGRSLGNDGNNDLSATLNPESNGEGSLPEDMPIEMVMARFKGVEMARKQQPDEQQYYSPEQRAESPDSGSVSQAEMEQMLQGLLYLFNYTAGYHGHNEQGDREGNKEGGYYVVGRDGFRRSTEYKANQFGYQPRFTIERVSPEETPMEETEKEAGLKGYEFKWFYL